MKNPEIKNTDFGYKTVDIKTKTKLVKGVFDSVASKYDLMNDLMSVGVHRLWKDKLVQYMDPQTGYKVIDIAGGSGDISLRILKQMAKRSRHIGELWITDINDQMLSEGQKKLVNHGLIDAANWACANSECLPFPDNFFDQYVVSFGLRNFSDKEQALREAYRVLKPGGKFFCLEFSKVIIPVLQNLYHQYAFRIIPFIGDKVAKDRDSYQYLVESIDKFYDQETFIEKIQANGFEHAKYYNFSCGVVALHIGWKF